MLGTALAQRCSSFVSSYLDNFLRLRLDLLGQRVDHRDAVRLDALGLLRFIIFGFRELRVHGLDRRHDRRREVRSQLGLFFVVEESFGRVLRIYLLLLLLLLLLGLRRADGCRVASVRAPRGREWCDAAAIGGRPRARCEAREVARRVANPLLCDTDCCSARCFRSGARAGRVLALLRHLWDGGYD